MANLRLCVRDVRKQGQDNSRRVPTDDAAWANWNCAGRDINNSRVAEAGRTNKNPRRQGWGFVTNAKASELHAQAERNIVAVDPRTSIRPPATSSKKRLSALPPIWRRWKPNLSMIFHLS